VTRPRTTTSPADDLGATLSDSKSRLINLEALAHRHENTPLGTERLLGSYSRNGGSFSAANTLINIGSVNVTVPSFSTQLEVIFGFSLFAGAAGGFLVRAFNSNGSYATQIQYYTNESFSHKVIGGTILVGCTGGSSTVSLQVFGQGITLINDLNDSAVFTVHTV
jgi:hypothetical protein